ncbi:MAG: glycoside hydrolase family 3 protein [Elusimicrobiales bacterium]
MSFFILLSLLVFGENKEFNEEIIYSLIFKSYDSKHLKSIIKDTKKGIGGIHLLWGNYNIKDTQKLTSLIYSNSHNLPPFIAIDYEGGSVYLHQTHGLMNLPSNMAIGRSADKSNTTTLFYIAGLELKKAGINMVFAPDVDVNTEIKNPIINIRAFSDNPQSVYEMAKSVITGLKAAGIINTLKHFPGHGMVDNDPHLTLPQTYIDPIELYKTHIYPFRKLIEEKQADAIMVSHILYTQLDSHYPASMSDTVIKRILREQLNFDGLIITDSLDMKAISSHISVENAALTALKNGADMVLIGSYPTKKVIKRIKKAAENGEIDTNELIEKYERIKRIKEKYNLKNFSLYHDDFDLAYKQVAEKISYASINIKKCKGISNIRFSKNLDLLLLLPERYLNDTISLYSAVKEINSLTTIYTDLTKLPERNKEESSIIVIAYFWPYIADKKIDEISKITKNYSYSVYINTLNPYDSLVLSDKFDCIIETFGINEFSMKAVSFKMKELSFSN